LHSGKNVEVERIGSFNPKPYVREKLEVGETGYLTANIKSPQEVKMGDTITDTRHPSPALPGSGDSSDGLQRDLSDQHIGLRTSEDQSGQTAVERLAFVYQPETSVALGFGFRCGFLVCCIGDRPGTVASRYGMDIIATYPSVIYKVTLTDGA